MSIFVRLGHCAPAPWIASLSTLLLHLVLGGYVFLSTRLLSYARSCPFLPAFLLGVVGIYLDVSYRRLGLFSSFRVGLFHSDWFVMGVGCFTRCACIWVALRVVLVLLNTLAAMTWGRLMDRFFATDFRACFLCYCLVCADMGWGCCLFNPLDKIISSLHSVRTDRCDVCH